MGRDVVLGRELDLHGTEGEHIDALESGNHEGSLAGDAAHLTRARDDHQLVGRTFSPARLENADHDHHN